MIYVSNERPVHGSFPFVCYERERSHFFKVQVEVLWVVTPCSVVVGYCVITQKAST